MSILKKGIQKHNVILCYCIVGVLLALIASHFISRAKNGKSVINSVTSENQPSTLINAKNINKDSKIIFGNNELGFKLMKEKLAEEKNENYIISPMSLCTILSLAQSGAEGETKKEILKLMGIENMPSENINKEYNQLMKYYNKQKDIIIKIANSVWLNENVKLNNEFKRTSDKSYNAKTVNLNFKEPASVNKINKWADANTDGKITKIVDKIDEQTIMILINALYFKGKWEDKFDERNTEKEEFTMLNGEKLKVDMMKDKRLVSYLKKENFEAIILPYSNGIEMNLFLLDKNTNTAQLINKINNEKFNNWFNEFTNEEIKMQIPKFKFEYGKSLTETLKKLGMINSFNVMKADFKNITDNVYISDIVQKCYISTDEKGTEAAAVTSLGTKTSCKPETNKEIEFIVNRPFVFTIRDNSNGLILFMGTVEKPEF